MTLYNYHANHAN